MRKRPLAERMLPRYLPGTVRFRLRTVKDLDGRHPMRPL
jgi:hypothetical protein